VLLDEKRIYFLVAASCFTLSIGILTSRFYTDSTTNQFCKRREIRKV
jgi:hypothetical protein